MVAELKPQPEHTYYIRKVFIVLFFHFLAKCAMQADDAFCYFNVVFFAPPFSFWALRVPARWCAPESRCRQL